MKVFNVGVVGAGAIARNVHLPVLLNMPNVRVAWLTDANPATAAAMSKSFGVPRVDLPPSPADLPAADVVLLTTPVGVRMPYYQALAARGSAVFAEKPFAITSADHARSAALFPPSHVACGYMRRTFESSQLFRDAIASQWFGPLQRIRVCEGARTARTGVDVSHYDNAKAAGGGVLMTLGTHAIDMAFYITQAIRFEILSRDIVYDGEIDRKVSTLMRLSGSPVLPESGIVLDFTVSWIDRQDNVFELQFPTIKLATGVAPTAPVSMRDLTTDRPLTTLIPPRRGATTAYQAFYTEWEWFLRDLEQGRVSPMSAASAAITTQAIESLYSRSTAGGLA